MENKIIATGVITENNKEYFIKYQNKKINFFDEKTNIAEFKGLHLEDIIKGADSYDYKNKKTSLGNITVQNDFILPAFEYLLSNGETITRSEEIIKTLLEYTKADYDKEKTLLEEQRKIPLDYNNPYDFGSINADKYYTQRNKQLFQYIRGKNETKEEFKGLFSLNKITRFNDIAGTSESKYIMEYWNGLEDKLITSPKLTREELTDYLDNEDIFDCNKAELESIIRKIIIHTKAKEDLNRVYEVINKGYFLDLEENKILENTNIKDFNPTYEQTNEALNVLLELITTDNYKRDMNVALVFKTMLHMPFHWIIKQIGYNGGNNIRGLLMNGFPHTTKTSSAEIGLWLYGECPVDQDSSMDTIASYVNKVSESTIPTILDEGYNLLSKAEMPVILKRQISHNESRSIMGGNNYSERKTSFALSTPIINCNETITHIIKDGLIRRYLILMFTKEMEISEDMAKEFELKYKHKSPESPLKILGCIGAEFREYIKPLILERSDKLIDLDSLVTDFFREILAKHNMTATEFNDELLTSDVEEMIMKGNHYNLKEDLVTKLNNEFRKIQNRAIYGKYYSIEDFIAAATKGGFNWLYYQTNNKQFIIDLKKFTDQAEKLTNQSSLTPEYLLSELGISLGSDDKGNPVQPSRIKVGEKQVYNAIRISDEDLTNKIFNIDISINDVEVMELEDKT